MHDPAVIILNYNGSGDTIACLESLAVAELGDSSVILLDNGSTSEDIRRLNAWNAGTGFFGHVATLEDEKEIALPPVHCLLLGKVNRGFAGGNNLVTRLALRSGRRDILLLNNDTTVAPDFLQRLLAGAARHPGSVLIPQIRLHDHPGRVWNCGGELRFPGRKVYNYAGAPGRVVPAHDFAVSFVTGCALLFRPAATGLLTERFFFGEEDMEFSLRLRRLGIPAHCIPDALVYHRVESTLAAGARKSEAFTLKRLVNLRTNLPGVEAAAGRVYYLVNLWRLLALRYRTGPAEALRRVGAIARAAVGMRAVGPAVCLCYVRGELPLDAAIAEDRLHWVNSVGE